MSSGYKIQGILDFSIELNKFVNVGLFQRGLYQVRITPRIPTKIPHRVEINYVGPDSSANSLTRSAIQDGSIPPSCVSDKSAVCTIGVITYKNEEIEIDDVFNIKIHLLLNGDYVNEINSAELFFDVELWFSDVVDRPIRASDMTQVSTRSIIIHFDALRGIHYHLPIIFDYFHLSAITITIHGSLISLCFPYNFKIGPDSSHLSPSRVQKLHWQICSVLITVILKLRKKFSEYLTLIPPWAQDRYQKLDSTLKQENISPLAQRCYQKCQENFIKLNASSLTKSYTEEIFRLPVDFPSDDGLSSSSSSDSSFNNHLNTIESDSAHICSCLIVLWQSFLRLVTKNDKIIQYLAKLHHSHRIKRFSEGFFTAEKPRRAIHSLCDKTSAEFTEITEKLRTSEYFSLLPRCDIECPTLDGNEETLPIIFEEQFDQDLPSSMSANSFPDFPYKESTMNDYPNHEKKNLREKLFTNLNRLNFPNSRMREEYSPLSASSQSRKSDGSTQSSLLTSASAYEISSKVTLNKYRKLSDDNNSLLLNDLLNDDSRKSLHNNNLSHSDSKSSQLRASESLNSLDLDSVSTEKNMNSTQTALSQLEINDSKEKILSLTRLSASSSNADSKASLKEEYQGTAYFPKPPVEFANSSNSSEDGDGVPDDNVFSDDDSKISSPPIDKSKKYVLVSPRRNSIEPRSATTDDSKCAILDIFRHNQCLMCGKNDCNECSNEGESERLTPSLKRLSIITPDLILFVESKEAFRNRVELRSRGFNIYSDFASLASRIPYFQCDQNLRIFSGEGLHLVICVHGLGGNSADLRLVRTYLEIGLPTTNFEFLMSQKNQGETFENFEVMTDRLVQEINYHIEAYSLNPAKISFIGHSLGNVLIRACIARPEMHRWRSKFHTFLSLSGPHLGTAYNTNNIVNMGLWFMQKFKKSESLLQLSMKDASDPKQSFLFKLSQEPGLQYFRYVLLCGSTQDHYVPIHSAHIELTEFALTDSSSWGNTYREMVSNILHPLMNSSHTKLIRYDVHFPSATMSLLGRAAHIAVLDSELFIEKFMVVVGLRYFA